jgi:ParB family transcriptional regulator, chromosome partitioning protein
MDGAPAFAYRGVVSACSSIHRRKGGAAVKAAVIALPGGGLFTVKQRLKLAAVSPKLLDIYAADGMTLEQLIAFTVTNDPARQEQVWEQLSRSCNREPYYIRRQLTEGAVRATDKRAMFVGVDACEAAGGIVTCDLFEQDDGGWLQEPALLDRLVIEKLKAEAEKLRTEGWK